MSTFKTLIVGHRRLINNNMANNLCFKAFLKELLIRISFDLVIFGQVVTHSTQNAETRSFRSFYFTAASLLKYATAGRKIIILQTG